MKTLFSSFLLKFRALINNRGKASFLLLQPKNFTILDVGCGNNSPRIVKKIRPDCYYIGLDIADYNQDPESKKFADEYLLVKPELFDKEILKINHNFDVIISAHNLEHCSDSEKTLRALCKKLKLGGQLYLSFPCESSVKFPSRKNTLNFFDDPTHMQVQSFSQTLQVLVEEGLEITHAVKRYRPIIYFLIGLVLEPFLFLRNEARGSTWALYGFETIIWARRK